MIIPQATTQPPHASALSAKELAVMDTPPPYEPSPALPPPAAAAGYPPHLKPTNSIHITRRMAELKDTFVLNPALAVPLPMRLLRKQHLSLSALMGNVDAVVHVVGSEALPKGGKTRVEVRSVMGSTRLDLHAAQPRAPLSIDVRARLGESIILIPRSFRGTLKIYVKLGEVELSHDLRMATRSFGDELFVGEWREEEVGDERWRGDEAVVDSMMGSVWVGYSGEVSPDANRMWSERSV